MTDQTIYTVPLKAYFRTPEASARIEARIDAWLDEPDDQLFSPASILRMMSSSEIKLDFASFDTAAKTMPPGLIPAEVEYILATARRLGLEVCRRARSTGYPFEYRRDFELQKRIPFDDALDGLKALGIGMGFEDETRALTFSAEHLPGLISEGHDPKGDWEELQSRMARKLRIMSP